MWVIHWGLLLRLPWKTWVCPCEGQVWRWCQQLGSQGFWQHQMFRGVCDQSSRKYSALKGYDNHYWPIHSSILAWRTPFSNREPWQATVYRVANGSTWLKQLCMYRCNIFSFFVCGSSAPVRVECEVGTAAWLLRTLVASVQGHRLPLFQELWRYLSLFCISFSCRSFSVAPPLQALRGLPSLESFSVVWCLGT